MLSKARLLEGGRCGVHAKIDTMDFAPASSRALLWEDTIVVMEGSTCFMRQVRHAVEGFKVCIPRPSTRICRYSSIIDYISTVRSGHRGQPCTTAQPVAHINSAAFYRDSVSYASSTCLGQVPPGVLVAHLKSVDGVGPMVGEPPPSTRYGSLLQHARRCRRRSSSARRLSRAVFVKVDQGPRGDPPRRIDEGRGGAHPKGQLRLLVFVVVIGSDTVG